MFRKHRRTKNRASTEKSLEQAQAARRAQERKHQEEKPVTDKLARLIAENNLAELIRVSLRQQPPPHRGAR